MMLRGKTALITGGTSGIGFVTARLFLANGARVAITGSNPAKLSEARSALGGDIITICADVQSLGAVCTENLIRVDAVMESPKLAE
jgi:NAD(P)-dependent dehydrogenase (short-subunit alcohol dehydrogenase family)